jgi:hypothetical protein
MNIRAIRLPILFVVYACLSTPAMAYLDGATASIVLQATIGAFATWLMYSRMFFAKVKALFVRADKTASTPEAE